MDVLRRLLETKAGRDQLEDILRRLKELEEAEPEEWEGLASTKCLSCNRPVTAPEYDEDEFSVVTGATGRTSLESSQAGSLYVKEKTADGRPQRDG